ncbi:phosphoribosyltransferase [Pseudomonas sp. R2.Fl]|nr:phosphoribosyltransferase [Pseudomonas sp. R2.Fl]
MQPHEFWQDIHAAGTFETEGPFVDGYPAVLDDGRQIRLPIRALADGRHGLASLIINQASFAVQDALAGALARRLAPFRPEIVVGLPTLGLTLAAAVARKLDHPRYVPLGTSRKFWYDEGLSVSLSSITTPDQAKRLYIDPRMLPLIENRRVALIDDVVSSGTSMRAGLDLLSGCGIEPVALGVAMAQTSAWESRLDAWPDRLVSVFSTPRLAKTGEGGWMPLSQD